MNLTEKLLSSHLVSGQLRAGTPISIRMDQTLTQDATGTMAYMQFEAMGIDKVKTDLSVSYVDHNTLQNDFMNADDHVYLQSVANKYGILFSRAGNGICHQVHLERFARPGMTLIGSDSHTPTSSAIGAFALGAGGLDVAKAMAGYPYTITMPKVVCVYLKGQLNPGVSSKDIILKLLEMLSVKGGVGKVFEYAGPGVKSLSVYQRATITNMGAELGATTSIFPSDENTLSFLTKQGRQDQYIPLAADEDCTYDETIEIDLSTLEPLVACPHQPDQVVSIKELVGKKVDQVAIGSCTNSGFEDLMVVASMLKDQSIAPNVSLVISCGSRQVLMKLMKVGALEIFVRAGARILECTCGPCIGMGQSPKSEGVSVRTFNRNFYGRSGTKSASVFLASPQVAAAAAIKGEFTDPRDIEYSLLSVEEPRIIDDSMILKPTFEGDIIRGPNIKPLKENTPFNGVQEKAVIIKVGDNITTDDIAPAGAKVLPYRSNIDKLSEFVFMNQMDRFDLACKNHGGGIIVAGQNYGQGSSREHAALAPMSLGIKAVIAKSFARIHHANLINFGIVPLQFDHEEDYDKIDVEDMLCVKRLNKAPYFSVYNETKQEGYDIHCDLTPEDLHLIDVGGALNAIKLANNE